MVIEKNTISKYWSILVQYILDFFALFYPNLCTVCSASLVRQEKVICSKCLYELPRTHFHKVKGNPLEKVFWGRVEVERVTAYFFFLKGSKYRKMIHLFKYSDRKDIGIELGRNFASELKSSDDFSSIDLILPVPLHPRKERKRGYNQSDLIAQGMSELLPAAMEKNILYRKIYTETQTKKSRFERWENMENVFGVKNIDRLEGKHVLLVDDVLTTGATLEGCAHALHEAENVKISVATLAFAAE